jgi:hypothetical protein
MRKILAIAGLTALTAAAGVYFAVWRPLVGVSEMVPLAEQALASDALLLAGVNVKQAAFLERWFIGLPPVSPVPVNAPTSEPNLLDHLRAVHVDPRSDVDYLLLGLYPNDAGAAGQVLVLTARFDPAAINGYLTTALRARPLAVGKYASYEVTLTDQTNCRPTATWAVTATPNWVLIAAPPLHARMLARLLVASAGDESALAWWRPLAREDVLSLGIANPLGLESVAPTAMLKPADIAIAADAFQRVYLGVGVKPVPPAGRLRLVLDAKDVSGATRQITGWKTAIAESRQRWAAAMPLVAALYDGVSIRSEAARSTVDITVDGATIANVQRIANELIAGVLGGFGIPAKTSVAKPAAEEIDAPPPAFEPFVAASRLQSYDPNATFAEKVDRITGPFGVRLDAIKQGATAEDGLELVVAAFSGAIPNLAAAGDRARLFVDSIKSDAGEELLRREECGRERNQQPASFDAHSTDRMDAKKTLRLVAGAAARRLQRIDGHVELRLPTRTETITLTHPVAGTGVEKYGVALRLTQVTEGRLSYDVTGPSERLLLVRALSAKRQPLATSMKLSVDFLFGGGSTRQVEHRGRIDALEIVLASEEQTLSFPFSLTDFSLAPERHSSAHDDAPAFAPYSEQALRQEYATAAVGGGPLKWERLPAPEKPRTPLGATQLEVFELSLDKAQAFYALKLDFTVRSHDIASFRRRFNVGQLRLTRIELRDGAVLTPPADDGTPAGARVPGSTWSAPIRFMSTPSRGVLSTSLGLLVDTKAKPEELHSVAGAFEVRFPLAIETLRLDDLTVGATAPWRDTTVTVVARSRQGLTLRMSKGGVPSRLRQTIRCAGKRDRLFWPECSDRARRRRSLRPITPCRAGASGDHRRGRERNSEIALRAYPALGLPLDWRRVGAMSPGDQCAWQPVGALRCDSANPRKRMRRSTPRRSSSFPRNDRRWAVAQPRNIFLKPCQQAS